MARVRLLHPQQTMDEDVNALSIQARYVWAFLPCHADREGRLADKPFGLKLAILPVDSADMNAILAELAAIGLITRYEHNGRRFIQIRSFVRYQRPHRNEAASIAPPPPDGAPTNGHGLPSDGQGEPPGDPRPPKDSSCRADPVPVIDPVRGSSRAIAPAGVPAPADNTNGICHDPPPPSKLSAYDLTQRFGIAWRQRYNQPWAPDRETSAAARDLLENMIGRMPEADDRAAALEDVMPALARYLADTSPSLLKNRHPFPWFVDRFNQYRVAEGAAAAQQVFSRPRWTGPVGGDAQPLEVKPMPPRPTPQPSRPRLMKP